jgi:perosamine synthetase
MNIPVNIPLLDGNEEKYVLECLRTGWISSEGPFVSRFEEQFSEYVGRKEGIAVSSGSAALDIAIEALEINPGDEVIMPTFTIISPAFSVVKKGAIPVLIDSDPNSWNMNVNQIEAKITKKTKAIVVVHIYGLPVDMNPITNLCQKYNLFLIEDAAEMHGQEYMGQKCGSFGDISIFSFYPNKHITTGEGGMIVVNDDRLAEKCRVLRNLSFNPTGRRFIHNNIGWNYRMTNLQAAIGLAQLERVEKHIEIKREIGRLYNDGLNVGDHFQKPLNSTIYANNIYWVYGLVASTQELSETTSEKLNSLNIGTRPFFWCMHEQPVFQKMGLFENEAYPVAEKLARNGFYIPSGLGLSKSQINEVIRIFNGQF